MMRYCYGIDIGGSKIELVVCDAISLSVEHRRRVDTPTQDFDAFVEAVAMLVTEADRLNGSSDAPVGLGMPGIADPVTGLHLSSNVPALNGRRVSHALQQRLARPVFMGNDCQCFALSEAQGGAANGLPSMYGAVLGTGAAGGYCVNGRLITGYNGIAGEWGHWPVSAALLARHRLPLLDCPCGLRGCLERYVSGPGLAGLYRLRGGDEATPALIASRAAAGEVLASEVLAMHLDLLGQGLATLVLAIDPHAIVLGGGLSKLAHLYAELPPAVGRHVFKGVRVPPILPPQFGDAGGARGAALLARQQMAAA